MSLDAHHKFTGKERDESTGLYDYGARYYDPAMGRFLSADTTVQSMGNPQTLNRYAYAANNPLRYIDPSGNDAIGAGFTLTWDTPSPELSFNLIDIHTDPTLSAGSPLSQGAFSDHVQLHGFEGNYGSRLFGNMSSSHSVGESGASLSLTKIYNASGGNSSAPFTIQQEGQVTSSTALQGGPSSGGSGGGGGGGGIGANINGRLLASSSIGVAANTVGIIAGGLALSAPTGVTQALGAVTLAKSVPGLVLNTANIYHAFTGQTALPSSALGFVANQIAPQNATAQKWAAVADLTLDLSFLVSARVGTAAAERLAIKVNMEEQSYGFKQVGFKNPTDLGKTADWFGVLSVIDTMVSNIP